jgi:hypothetical protein
VKSCYHFCSNIHCFVFLLLLNDIGWANVTNKGVKIIISRTCICTWNLLIFGTYLKYWPGIYVYIMGKITKTCQDTRSPHRVSSRDLPNTRWDCNRNLRRGYQAGLSMEVVSECCHLVAMSDESASFHVLDVTALSVHLALLSWVRPNQYDPLLCPHTARGAVSNQFFH